MKAINQVRQSKRKPKACRKLSTRILSADHPFSKRKSWREEMCPLYEKQLIQERF